jgi:hypothetical protein
MGSMTDDGDAQPTAALPAEVVQEVQRTLHDLVSVRLAPSAWPAVAGDLARLDAAVARQDAAAVRATLVPLSQAAFEGKVRGRLAGAGTRTPAVVPTKRSAVLPLVGAACAAAMMLIGYQIGGAAVLAGTAALSVFVFGVALAGTRAARDRAEAVRERKLAPTAERTEPPPTVVRSAIADIEAHLG